MKIQERIVELLKQEWMINHKFYGNYDEINDEDVEMLWNEYHYLDGSLNCQTITLYTRYTSDVKTLVNLRTP